MAPSLLTVREAAERLRVSPRVVRALIGARAIEYVAVSPRRLCIPEAALSEFVASATLHVPDGSAKRGQEVT